MLLIPKRSCGEDTPLPPVFCEKSAQPIKNKGRSLGKERQECSRACNRLEGKDIKEVKEVKEVEEVEELRGMREEIWEGTAVTEGLGGYSQPMVRNISEIVNQLSES
jgi:hypothetical protein